jgi:hypothetical protein
MVGGSDNNATLPLGTNGVIKEFLGIRFEDFWLKVFWNHICEKTSYL